MTSPRKFSEKIALQKQKEAEGTAEFERIMKEVSDATVGEAPQSVLSDCTQSRTVDYDASPVSSPISVRRESRSRCVGVGPIRRPSDRKVDRSPYGSSNIAYLSPPNESYWRRASSDSAIHQSLQQQTREPSHGVQSPLNLSLLTQPLKKVNLSNVHNNSEQHVANLGTRPSQAMQYDNSPAALVNNSLGKNTGSLPDLTSVHYAPEQCKQNELSRSPINNSPLTVSPATMSPTAAQSLPHQQHHPHHPHPQQIHPQQMNQPQQQQPHNCDYLHICGKSPCTNNCCLTDGQQHHQQQQQHHQQQQQQHQQNTRMFQGKQTSHLSFTNLPDLLGYNQGKSHDNYKWENNIHGSHGHLSSIGIAAASNLTQYRSPDNRPSPGSSPAPIIPCTTPEFNPSSPSSPGADIPPGDSIGGYLLNTSFRKHFEQFSLIDTAKGGINEIHDSHRHQQQQHHNNNIMIGNGKPLAANLIAQSPPVPNIVPSAISSPSSMSHHPGSGIIHQSNVAISNQINVNIVPHGDRSPHHNLQQQQQQQSQQQQHQHQQQHITEMKSDNIVRTKDGMIGNQNITPDNIRILSPDHHQQQQMHHQKPNHLDNMEQQHDYHDPSTPSSIPEIVFSDFSSGYPEFTDEMFGSLDLELGPVDVAGLQLLSDPNSTMIADPAVEDSFRRDIN